MRLNQLRPAAGSRPDRDRICRGNSSGKGRTGGRGDNGQLSRSGGYQKVGFEGGQMPMHRRLPKRGFRSGKDRFVAEVRLSELKDVEGDTVDIAALKAADVIPTEARRAKIVKSGDAPGAVTVRGVKVTAGARAAIEHAGGKVEG
jgi:large subunit ribosomal protein L15